MASTTLDSMVRAQLDGDSGLDASRVKIMVDGSVVTLGGVVDTLHEKLAAAEDARRLTGVSEVHNELIVDKSKQRVADADLKATAQAGLDANGLVPKGAITLNAADGWITLTGNVHHLYQKQAAEHVIRHLTGVQGMTDKITVSKDPSVDITKSITAALTRNAAVDANAIKVADVNGVVTLSGAVKSEAERQEVERAAAQTAGVVSVENQVTVTS